MVMARLAFFVGVLFSLALVFNVAASSRKPLPPPEPDDKPSILSIDGGGVKGIIPARVLVALEKKLNELENSTSNECRIADYFDLVAGTSTGGIVAALLTIPDEDGNIRSAEKASDFYMNYAADIFPPRNTSALTTKHLEQFSTEARLSETRRMARMAMRERKTSTCIPDWILDAILELIDKYSKPLYDGEALRTLAKEILGEKTMNESATNLLITSYDIKIHRPVIFSTFRAKRGLRNVPVADACIATSAFPVYLPPHYFEHNGTEYNLVDGGIAGAVNPMLLALLELIEEYTRDRLTTQGLSSSGAYPVRLLSLGTGEGSVTAYSAQERWGALQWLYQNGTSPLISILMEAMPQLTDLQAEVLFRKVLGVNNDFLKIQKYNLSAENNQIANADSKNMEELYKIGDNLVYENVTALDVETGEPIVMQGTNDETLEMLASSLVEERKKRLRRQAHARE